MEGVQALDTDDLAVFAAVAWRQGHGGEAVRINERVHSRLLRTDPVQAAVKAAELGLAWLARGHIALARNWAQRAEMLLRGVPESGAHGYVMYLTGVMAADADESTQLAEAARALTGIAGRVDDAGVATLARVLEGLSAVAAGDAAGLATLDDVLLSGLDERVPMEWAGDVYRRVLNLAQRRSDRERLRAWTRSMDQWCETTQASPSAYRAICDVYRLSVESGRDTAELVRRGVDLRRLVAEVDAVAAGLADGLLARGMGRTG
ncbi:response regulator containing a CheY-like receiver domain and an HTH DNA-binding domain [Mycolicibacterium brisbanense]|uniref:Response regulator containing a CheY-like receiver domain and an HTH DNA-binding domain n=1 Tax=Mycolicibacterium brisbanense TaxID=146020 RepID=A0A100W4M8_9MYCO|nr:response regulator containing a CheY-like receiver domain and an HTH DNA-binding domain [Mycolicibacterium brisbanense]